MQVDGYLFPREWTAEDLEAIPSDNPRYEVVDGALLVPVPRTNVHQVIAGRLGVALDEDCPGHLNVTQAVQVRIRPGLMLIPDVLVTTDEAAARGGTHYAPQEVVLAVEVVSPHTVSVDRVLKPGLYAEAGIPHYWRVETVNGLVVHTYRRDATGVYVETGQHRELVDVAEPWPLKLSVARLTPRHLGS